ncbi:hypothetical protein BDFB_013722, partial [Asbolus verrucosus]
MNQYDKVRKVEGHDCSLPQDDELIDLYINGGICVDLRRKFRQYLMISPGNPETKSVLKSSAQIRLEEARHLRNHYYMIHPFSEARSSWERIMIVVYLGLYVLMPMELGLPVTRPLRLDVWSYKLRTINFFLCLLILIWWSTSATFLVLSKVNGYTMKYFQENPDVFTPMMESFFQVVKAFMLISISNIQSDNALSMVLNLIFLFMGSVLNMVIL